MKVIDGPWMDWSPVAGPAAITVGVLDGVHRGHRTLLERLTTDGLVPTVMTFEPHPVEVLSPGVPPRLITTIDERIELLDSVGVSVVAVLDLAEIRDLAPEEFVSEVLVGRLGAKRIVAGVDFQFGKNRTGSIAMLSSQADELGFVVDVVDLVVSNGTVSSSRIRGLIESQRVAEAAELLGTRYRLTSRVVAGDKRGRAIGFPTANLVPPQRKVIPGDGVYAAYARVGGKVHRAAVNVGVRPTFGGGDRLIEAYLIDFDGDLYGEQLTVEFVENLRDELRFESTDELVARMDHDIVETRAILESTPSNMG